MRRELQELEPLAPGPRAAADGGAYGPPYELHAGAARFDQSIAWHAWPPARAGTELLAAVGATALERHATGLVARVRAGLAEHGLAGRLAPADGPTPIVSVRCEDPDAVVGSLRAAGVRAAARDGAVRAGFHVFNDDEHADRFVAGVGGGDRRRRCGMTRVEQLRTRDVVSPATGEVLGRLPLGTAGGRGRRRRRGARRRPRARRR